MSSGVPVGRSLTLVKVLNPPGNPWLRDISTARVPFPRGVRILRNSSDSADSSDGTATFDRHTRLRAAKEKLRDLMDTE
jgi:hypothetical protein